MNVEPYVVFRQALLDSVFVLHAHGVEHADLKPSNLTLRDDGSIGIQDFGVSVDDHDCPGDSCFELRRLKENLFGLPSQ
jgi:serine/threonine protein kinase